MTPAQTAATAQTIVERVLCDLMRRKGLVEAWEALDAATRVAIVQTLVAQTQAVLDGSEPGASLHNVEACWLQCKQT